jgi:cyclin B
MTKSAHFGYMAHQTDINEKMRAILIDWLVEVHLKFKLMPETMYLTVNIIDRFLERKMVIRQKLQLVGVTAMLLASKYEEIYAPEVRDFVYITDKAYTREQILAMESSILSTLDFRITVPTTYVFLNRYLKAAAADERTTLLATFFVERTLQDYKMLAHLPSKLAAAAVNMALRTLRGRDAWTATMAHYAGFSQEELRGTICDMQDMLTASVASSLQAVRKKYQNTRFGEVANIPLVPLE